MSEPERVWHYHLDAEGHLWHEGAEIDDPEVLLLFMKGLEALSDGRFRVFCQGEECLLTPEDTPYVVTNLSPSPSRIDLIFPGDYRELLDPATLFVGAANVLYCKVRGGRFTARFNRRSYLELAKQVTFDPRRKIYFLTVDNKRYPIKGVT